jgi:hypothetical protein
MRNGVKYIMKQFKIILKLYYYIQREI